LNNGADFTDFAAKFSNDDTRIKGGDLGYFHAGQSDDPDFDTVIQKLKVGEISPVIKSLKGFYMVKLIDKKPPRQLPFEELKDKLRQMLLTSEKDRLFSSWMDGLKKNAKIVYAVPITEDKGSKP
jgi:peptidyl-prolyl cis-trans isomerase C